MTHIKDTAPPQNARAESATRSPTYLLQPTAMLQTVQATVDYLAMLRDAGIYDSLAEQLARDFHRIVWTAIMGDRHA